jgi:hypothetical protein
MKKISHFIFALLACILHYTVYTNGDGPLLNDFTEIPGVKEEEALVCRGYNDARARMYLHYAAGAYSRNEEVFEQCVDKSDRFLQHETEQFIFNYDTNIHCSASLTYGYSGKESFDIYVAFRGTDNFKQLIFESLSVLTTPKVPVLGGKGGHIQRYFHQCFSGLWPMVFPSLKRAYFQNPFHLNEVVFTGHSLGGALASLGSFNTSIEIESWARKAHLPKPSNELYTFGQPRVGD